MKTKRLLTAFMVLLLAAGMPAGVLAADSDQVTQMIDLLPDEKDVSEENAEKIEEAMSEYNSLGMADKLNVPNYKKLERAYRAAQKKGYIKHEMTTQEEDRIRAEQEQQQMSDSGTITTESLEFNFSISASSPRLSLIMYYVTDLNGDGVSDPPSRIVLTSPAGIPTPIPASAKALEDSTMNINITWEDEFVQLDVASASEGRWRITVSDPVTFKRIPYAGVMQTITPEEDKQKPDAATPEEKPQKKDSDTGRIAFIIGCFVAIAVIFTKFGVFKPLPQTAKGKKNKEKKIEEDIPKKMSDQEIEEQIRKEYLESRQNDGYEDEDPDDYEYTGDEEGFEPLEESDMTEKFDYGDLHLEEYEEGDTGFLHKKDAPGNKTDSGPAKKDGPDDGSPDDGDHDGPDTDDDGPKIDNAFLDDSMFDI